ncbi:MAG: DNA polymerase III subunit gamma/tau [Bacteroidales bacterium]|jgi:DNA polymerase-3 subunit gamma/tau|nr:DNA polymerase III subunit gamma/tau [Bacteroidales bacterium]
MEQFIVSARKYRPDSFSALIGQENIATTLKNSIIRGQVANAYLFCGPRGVGKTSAARIFAKTINCLDPTPDMDPCGKCESCRAFAEGRSYNIHELDAASNNSVEDIRNLTDQVRIPPQVGKYSVFIIDEVHMLSQAAFNAFLKTLEEPPSYAIFILATTEKHKILPTIMSRCQTYDFNRISVDDIVKNLKHISSKEGVDISADAMHIIAQKADGAMRDALTLFDQTVAFCGKKITYDEVIRNLNVLDYDYYFSLTEDFLSGNYGHALVTFDEILGKGFNAAHFISGLSTHFRDLLVCKNSSSVSLLELAPTVADKYKAIAVRCTLPFIYEALNVTTSCESQYKLSGNGRLLIEFALLKLCGIMNKGLSAKSVSEPAVQAPKTVTSAPVPKPAPVPAKTAAIPASHSTVSIKEILKDKRDSAKDKGALHVTTEPDEPFSFEKLKMAWLDMADVEQKPRMAVTLRQTEPLLKDDGKTVVFRVISEAQKSWIERKKLYDMEGFLQKELHNKSLRMEVEVVEVPKEDSSVPYMPSERAKYLADKYPEVKKLEDDLGLQIK